MYKIIDMERIIELIKAFEKRNNISIAVTFYGDGSSQTEEFWDNEELNESDNLNQLEEFLLWTDYQLDENGRCHSPVRLKPA